MATRFMTGAIETYGWLWSCCEDVEKGRRAMLSLVLDPLSEYGCDFFFGFLVFICTYPRGTFFFSPHSPISLWMDSGPPARHWLTYGFVLKSRDGSVGWDSPRSQVQVPRYNILGDVCIRRHQKKGRRPRAASGFWLFNLGGHLAAAGGLPQILPIVMNEID